MAVAEHDCQCLRCRHKWQKRQRGKPTLCPKCHSPYWDKPRQKGAKK